ncbi:MAG: hypothetical protein ACRCXZ_08640 [Patescibacteria group bacterium]
MKKLSGWLFDLFFVTSVSILGFMLIMEAALFLQPSYKTKKDIVAEEISSRIAISTRSYQIIFKNSELESLNDVPMIFVGAVQNFVLFSLLLFGNTYFASKWLQIIRNL